VAQHLVVDGIALLHGVEYAALLVLAGGGHGRYGLVAVGIERVVGLVELLDTVLLQVLIELVVDKLEALDLPGVGLGILGGGGETALEVVEDWQQALESLLAGVLDQLRLVAQRALAEVVEVGIEEQVFLLFLLELGVEPEDLGLNVLDLLLAVRGDNVVYYFLTALVYIDSLLVDGFRPAACSRASSLWSCFLFLSPDIAVTFKVS